MSKLNSAGILAIAALVAAGFPPSSYASAIVRKPRKPKVVTDFDREQLAKAQAKREKKKARNLKIWRAM